MERVTIWGNVSDINYIIGYDETDLGLATVCLAGNHILSFINVSFLLCIKILLICIVINKNLTLCPMKHSYLFFKTNQIYAFYIDQ